MILLLAASVFAKGDSWTYERAFRWLNVAEDVDLTNVDRLEYRVASSEPLRVARKRRLAESRIGKDAIPPAPGLEPELATLDWTPSGWSTSDKPLEAIGARIDRIEWALGAEQPARKFPAVVGGLPAAEVSFSLEKSEAGTQVLKVRYEESETVEPIRFDGVATVSLPSRLVKSMHLEAAGVRLPGGTLNAYLSVDQRLLESNLKNEPAR